MTAIFKSIQAIVVCTTAIVLVTIAVVYIFDVLPTLTVSSFRQGSEALDELTRTREITITEVLSTIVSTVRNVVVTTTGTYSGVVSVHTSRHDPVPVFRDPERQITALIPGEIYFGVDLSGRSNLISVDSTGDIPIVTVSLPRVVCTGKRVDMGEATFDTDGGSPFASYDPMADVTLVNELQNLAETRLSMDASEAGLIQQTAQNLETDITMAIHAIYPDCTVIVVFEQNAATHRPTSYRSH